MKIRKRRRGEGRVFMRPNSDKWWIQYSNPTLPAEENPQREPTGRQEGCGGAVLISKCCKPKVLTESDMCAHRRDAEKYLANVMKKVGSAELGHSTFLGVRQQRVAVRDLIEDYKKKRTADAIRNGRSKVDPSFTSQCKKALELFGDLRAMSMDQKFWVNWTVDAGAELLEDYEPASINRWIEIVAAAMTYAVEIKTLAGVPCVFKRVMYDEDGNARKVFFEQEEFIRLLEATDDEDLRDFYTFGFFMGWRSGSIKKLEWSEVNMKEEWIELLAINAKERQKNVMPFGPRGCMFYNLMQKRWARRQFTRADGTTGMSKYVFHRQGTQVGYFAKSWKTACRRAGLMEPVLDEKGKPMMEKVDGMNVPLMCHSKIFHDFRRTACRNIYIATGKKDWTKMITGHRTDIMFDRYNIGITADKAEAIKMLMAHLLSSVTEGQMRTNVLPFSMPSSTQVAHSADGTVGAVR